MCVKQKNKAQSLVETVVAIGIIVVAIVAILSVGLTSLVLGGQSSERVQATNLAREGIEVINAIVSSNRLDPAESWPYGVTNGDWLIDYNTTELLLLDNDADNSSIVDCTNCYLCKQSSDLYTHADCLSHQVFRRMVSISDGGDLGDNCVDVELDYHCERKIISTVYWIERGREHSLILESHLTDWR